MHLIVVLCFFVCTTNVVASSQNEDQKKTNIPLVPTAIDENRIATVPSSTTVHLNSGKHPVVHEYVSDRVPTTRPEKKHSIPMVVNTDPYASIEIDKQASKRFQLYPKWFSNKVPSIFGKRFSKNYYYPFIANNKIGRSRDNIARHAAMKSHVHELPASWLAPSHHRSRAIHIRRGGGRSFRRGVSRYIPVGAMEPNVGYTSGGTISPYEYGPSQLQLSGEMVDIPDAILPYNRHRGYSMSRVPHGLMQRMDPSVYQPLPSKIHITLHGLASSG